MLSTRVDVGDQAIEVTNGYTKVVDSYYSEAQRKALQGTLVHVHFQGDNKYLEVYANERRIANNVGKPAENMTLSDARAAAVKPALVDQYGVSAAQLSTKGYGDTKPVADNKTAAGRQNNRRVDLVKS